VLFCYAAPAAVFLPYVGLCCRLCFDIQRISFCSEQLGAARFLPESHITTALPLGLLKRAQIWCRFLWLVMWIVAGGNRCDS
jgi:hypothetical protein